MKVNKQLAKILKIEPGWKDKDHLMEIVIIKLFKDFVEKELPGDLGWNRDKKTQELLTLYEYFKQFDFVENFEPSWIDKEAYKVYNNSLLKLVKLRGYLWA